MTDTNQLPEPELGYIKTDKSNQPAFSARQMREAMLVCGAQNAESDPQAPLSLTAAPQQAEVTDDIRPEDFTVDVVVKPMGGFAPVNTQGVRVTHKPTGISVTCDVARSQHTNRHQAFEKLRAILALHSSTAPDLSCKSVQARLATQWGYVRPAAVPMTDAHPMQPIVIAKDGRIRFKKNQIVDDLYELHRVHKLDLNEMARRNYSQEDRNQFAQLIGYSVGGWGTLSYATGVEKADAIAEALAAQAKKETP